MKKLRDADQVLKIEHTGFKRGELNMISRGTGKSMAAQRWIEQNTDQRLSAISRDGNTVEINYHSYAAENIPGFLAWAEEHGVTDYTLKGPHIIFADMTDADLFWMTFIGIKANRFFQMRKSDSFGDAREDFNTAQAQAIQGGAPVVIRQQNGDYVGGSQQRR